MNTLTRLLSGTLVLRNAPGEPMPGPAVTPATASGAPAPTSAPAPQPAPPPASADPSPAPTPSPGAPSSPPEASASPSPSPGSASDRISELVAQRHAERRRAEAAEARANLAEELLSQLGTGPAPQPGTSAPNAPVPSPALTQGDLDVLVNQRAAQLAFDQQCNEVVRQGNAAKPDFSTALTSLRTLAGGTLPRSVAEAAIATGKAVDVIYTLGKDPLLADKVLSLPPVQQAVELASLAAKLGAPAPSPEISRVPAPITPQVGSGGTPAEKTSYDTSVPIDQWMEIRNAEVAASRGVRR